MPDVATLDRDDLKDALVEALRENRSWLKELVQEALIEVADAEARREADIRAYADRRRVYPGQHGSA